jgi:hypothetical protein
MNRHGIEWHQIAYRKNDCAEDNREYRLFLAIFGPSQLEGMRAGWQTYLPLLRGEDTFRDFGPAKAIFTPSRVLTQNFYMKEDTAG